MIKAAQNGHTFFYTRADHDNKTVLLHRSDQPCENGSARPRILPEIECGVKMK